MVSDGANNKGTVGFIMNVGKYAQKRENELPTRSQDVNIGTPLKKVREPLSYTIQAFP